MQARKNSEQDQYLPSNLLQDDDIPTTTSLKQQFDDKRSFAFSAPPILFDIGYKFDEDWSDFNDFNVPETNGHHGGKTYSKNGNDSFEDWYAPPSNSTRKLSLQNEDYMGYQMINIPNQNYYPTISPEQQLINNLPQVAKWSRDQNGSRAVQNVFETGEQYTKELIFSFIFKQHESLMKDRFGNYVFQKIFERGSEKQKKKLFDVIKSKLINLSEHCYGCRVVQKAIEYVHGRPQLQEDFLAEICSHTLYLIENQNGNHVLQKCCEILSPKVLTKIAQKIVQNLKTLAFHPFGCRVIQKYLENCKGEASESLILKQLLQMTLDLSQCQYGNYVMQHIVLNCKQHRAKALEVIYSNFVFLSYNKYASNVIEKVIKTVEPQYIEKLAQLAIESSELNCLAKHQFGNYVMQSLIEKMSRQKKLILKAKLKQNQQEISKSQCGRHVLMQLQKYK